MTKIYQIPLVVRGEVIFDDMVEHGGRINNLRFQTPDAAKHLRKIVLADCASLADLYTVSLDEIIDFLVELGKMLDFKKNSYLQEAYEISCLASNMPVSILRHIFETQLQPMLTRAFMEDVLDAQIERPYLEGWVAHTHTDGRVVETRAFGSRIAQVIPGNLPLAPVTQMIRSALTRSDTIFKMPSNDPATASAVARTMVDLDPHHPITRHITTTYWKGGDESVEGVIYRPQFVDKLIVWGGESSINHARKYLQPGLSVLPFDPKFSNSIIGREAFASEHSLREAAVRLAADIGALNQEGCVNSRVTYVECGTSEEGIAQVNRLGQLVYEAMLRLPERISTRAKTTFAELAEQVESISLFSDEFRVIGGNGNEGAIIVSQSDQTVEFANLLAGRTANLVPVDNLEDAIGRLSYASQTVGVYPESLKARIRDKAAMFGAQRIVSLGYATAFSIANRLDAVEPMRQMCRWIVDETSSPERVRPVWVDDQTPAEREQVG